MARKSVSDSPSLSSATTGKMQFVNYDLTKEDKDKLRKMSIDQESLLKAIDSLVSQGYKISFSWDEYSQCFAVFLIGFAKECVNQGFILTGRASSSTKALASLLYKHEGVFKGVWHDRVLQTKPDDDF